MKHDYDTTLARMAGNIAAGFVGLGYVGPTYDSWWVVKESVRLARNIVEEIRRPETATKMAQPGWSSSLKEEDVYDDGR